jgi:tagatose 6-phosphate kinase
MCITLVDEQNRTATELIEEAAAVTSAEAQKLLTKLEGLLQHAKVLVLSGTLAPRCGEDFYAQCVKLANRASVQTILDAKGAPLELALREKPFVVKPNRSELSATVNQAMESDSQSREAIRKIISMGATWAVVTHGPAETIVSNGREFWKLQTPKVQVINPIGSGDSFAAGIAIGLLDGEEVPEACALGVACGAANAMTEFAGHVEREKVLNLRGAVALKHIA